MLKRISALTPALLVLFHGLWIGPRYDRYVLPSFDGFIYDSMADNPGVFTLAPWGYRILTPWIIHLLPFSSAAVGFFWLNLMLLAGAVFLVGWWLRRLGFREGASTMGGLTLALTPPLQAVLDYQVLVDPLALFITVVILHALVAPHWPTLTALFAIGAITKEMCLLPLFVVPFVFAARMGWRRAARPSMIIAAPSLALLFLLRLTWGEESSRRSLSFLASLPGRAGDVPIDYAAAFAGATLIAFLGFLREEAMEVRAMGSLLWFGNVLAVLANPYGFSPGDLVRIWLFAWTPALPLVLRGLGFRRTASGRSETLPSRWRTFASAAAVLAALGLALSTDSYRRAPAGESPNPVVLLGRFRESLKTARALEDGETFTFDALSGRFAGPVAERFNLTEGRRQRWFLFHGFGSEAAFESGVPVFQERAECLLPVLVPRRATLSMEFGGPRGAFVGVRVGHQEIGMVPADGSSTSLSIPPKALFRGDNMVALRGPDGVTIHLRRFEVRLVRESARP